MLLQCVVVWWCGGVVVWPQDNANVVTTTYGCERRGGGQPVQEGGDTEQD